MHHKQFVSSRTAVEKRAIELAMLHNSLTGSCKKIHKPSASTTHIFHHFDECPNIDDETRNLGVDFNRILEKKNIPSYF